MDTADRLAKSAGQSASEITALAAEAAIAKDKSRQDARQLGETVAALESSQKRIANRLGELSNLRSGIKDTSENLIRQKNSAVEHGRGDCRSCESIGPEGDGG